MKALLALLILFSPLSAADSLIVTVCDDPVLFIYGTPEQTAVLMPDQVEPFVEQINKDIEQNKAALVEAETFSNKAVCGSLF